MVILEDRDDNERSGHCINFIRRQNANRMNHQLKKRA
jgi:hypothetical protein